MKLEELLPNSHRNTADIVVDLVIKKEELIPLLIKELQHKNNTLAMRTSRVLQLTYVKKPEIVQPYLSELLDILLKLEYQGTIRSLLYIFQTAWKSLNEDEFGYLFDYAFNKFEDVGKEPAVRIYALAILNNAATERLPEIKEEMKQLMEFHYSEGSPAIKACIRKGLKQLSK